MISENYQKLKDEISRLAKECGRDPNEIELVAVSKTVKKEKILEAYEAGTRNFGESRVQEALLKIAELPSDIQWHFIGSLQMNKVRKVVGNFILIHSVDSFKLAHKIAEVSAEQNLTSRILLEVNTSGEKSKHGFSPDELRSVFPEMTDFQHLSIEGLMTMAPLTEDREKIRSCFADLRNLKEELNLAHLWVCRMTILKQLPKAPPFYESAPPFFPPSRDSFSG